MSHDVYVCYADEDEETAEKVFSALEKRKLKCWMKNHNVRKDMVGEMMDAINKSYVMVLIYSMHSKFSDYVNTEVDMAFSNEIPIMVFRSDDSEIDGALEFFLKPQPKFDAYKNPDAEFKRLINHTSDLVKNAKKGNVVEYIKGHKIPIAIGLVVLIIAAACIYMFVPLDEITNGEAVTQFSSGNTTINITKFHVDDVTNKGYAWNFSYGVEGSISPVPAKGSKCVVTSDFYDKSGKLVNSTSTLVDDLQIINDGFLLGSTTSSSNDIARVEVQIVNSKQIVLAQSEAQLKNIK
jgi:hypothetical protein